MANIDRSTQRKPQATLDLSKLCCLGRIDQRLYQIGSYVPRPMEDTHDPDLVLKLCVENHLSAFANTANMHVAPVEFRAPPPHTGKLAKAVASGNDGINYAISRGNSSFARNVSVDGLNVPLRRIGVLDLQVASPCALAVIRAASPEVVFGPEF